VRVTRRLAPLTGVVFVLLLIASIVLDGSEPGRSASGAKVLAFYTHHQNRMAVSSAVVVVSVFFGLFFYGFLSDHLGREEGVRGLTRTAFGGAVLFAGGGCLGAGAAFALTDATSWLSPASAQTLSLVRLDLNWSFIAAGLSVLLAAYGLAILKSRLLPRWLGWAALPLAVVALVPVISWAAFFLAGIWTLIASVALFQRPIA
jgi:hypothetical protein